SDPSAKQRKGELLVAQLAAASVDAHGDAGRRVRGHDGGLGLVAMLATGAGALGRVPVDLRVGNRRRLAHAQLQHGDGDGGGLHAAPALGRRPALPAVASRLAGEEPRGALAIDRECAEPRPLLEDAEAKARSAARPWRRYPTELRPGPSRPLRPRP